MGCESLDSLEENRSRYSRPFQYADYKSLILLARAALLTTTDQAHRLTIFPNTLLPLLLTVRRETSQRRRRRVHSTRTAAARPVVFCRKQRPAPPQTPPLSTTLPPHTPNTVREARKEGLRVWRIRVYRCDCRDDARDSRCWRENGGSRQGHSRYSRGSNCGGSQIIIGQTAFPEGAGLVSHHRGVIWWLRLYVLLRRKQTFALSRR